MRVTRTLAGLTAGAFALALAACSPDGDPSGGATPDNPAISGGDPFCDLAVQSLAAAEGVTQASDDLNAIMSDPEFFSGGGDIDGLHTAGEKIIANGQDSIELYDLGATVADDPEVQAAFTGMSDFIEMYSIPLGQAASSASSGQEFFGTIQSLFTNPEMQTLLQSTPGWATTTHDFIVERCGIDA